MFFIFFTSYKILASKAGMIDARCLTFPENPFLVSDIYFLLQLSLGSYRTKVVVLPGEWLGIGVKFKKKVKV